MPRRKRTRCSRLLTLQKNEAEPGSSLRGVPDRPEQHHTMTEQIAAGSVEGFGACVRTPDIAGRAAIDSPEAAAEIGEVAKADVTGDFPDVPVAILRPAKHTVSAGDAVIEKKS